MGGERVQLGKSWITYTPVPSKWSTGLETSHLISPRFSSKARQCTRGANPEKPSRRLKPHARNFVKKVPAEPGKPASGWSSHRPATTKNSSQPSQSWTDPNGNVYRRM